ncbi:MAG TPA: aspartate aminotransferase family protein [Crenotrichaceae bacterium]|nr:aspartate aminotransferase family protein [Crenotrichaceae bacterium]
MDRLVQEVKDRYYSCHEIFKTNINPKMMKVLGILGFNKSFKDAQGCYLYTEDGQQFLDFHSGEGATSIGYNNPQVISFLKDIMDMKLPNMIQLNCNVLGGMLAEKLLAKAPDYFTKVYFGNSGAEAVETALKFVRCATGKNRIIYCKQSFHGLTYGALSVCGDQEFKEGFGELMLHTSMIDFNDLQALDRELQKGDVAAFIAEPIQGREVIPARPGYLTGAAELCQKYSALFILDEIQTSLGRTGKFFYLEHENVKPDILLVAKALSGGLVPVSAVLIGEDIYNKVYSNMERCYIHHSTYGYNTLSMAAGLATLEVIENQNLVDHADKMGVLIMDGLEKIKQKYDMVKDVRGKGLMFAVELGKPSSFSKKLQWNLVETTSKGLYAQVVVIPLFQEYGIISMVSGLNSVIKFIPPVIITEKEVDYFLDSLDKVLHKAQFTSEPWNVLYNIVKRSI